MTPIEKAETALNRRIDRLQTNLRETKSVTTRQFLAQSLVVCVGLGEALTDYVRAIGQYAQRRYSELKQENDTLIARHAALLEEGNGLLAQLKAHPDDRAVRAEIDRTQRDMAAIQKTLRRSANSFASIKIHFRHAQVARPENFPPFRLSRGLHTRRAGGPVDAADHSRSPDR